MNTTQSRRQLQVGQSGGVISMPKASASQFKITGVRPCTLPTKEFGVVVMMVYVLRSSPLGVFPHVIKPRKSKQPTILQPEVTGDFALFRLLAFEEAICWDDAALQSKRLAILEFVRDALSASVDR